MDKKIKINNDLQTEPTKPRTTYDKNKLREDQENRDDAFWFT